MSSPMDLRQQRVFEARLAGLTARLADEGIPRATVDRLLERWDEVAWQRGLMRDTPGWFAQAPVWIREQLAAERS